MRNTTTYRTADEETRMPPSTRSRTLLALALCLGVVAAACGPQDAEVQEGQEGEEEDTEVAGDPDAADAHLRLMWWGSDVRHNLTNEAAEAFHEEHDVSVETEFMGWEGYWDRIATLVAGGNAPDVMQQDYRYLSEYAGRGAIVAMDEFVPDPLGVDDWPEEIIGSGILSDQLFGVPWAVNTQALIYDPEALEEAGLELPDTTTWTWEEFADFAQEISDNTEEGTYGVADAGGWEPFLDLWLISHGKALYTEDGELGFEEEDLVEYWQFWTDLRESGAATPADITATHDAQPENSAIVNEQAVLDYLWSNQITAWSETAGRHLELAHWPQGSEGTGSYIKASLLLSITSDAEHPEESAMLVDYMVNSTEAGEILGVERGAPANLDVREAIFDDLEDIDQQQVAFVTEAEEIAAETPAPPPGGAGEIDDMVQRIYEDVIFENLTVEEAAEQFFQQAPGMIQHFDID